VTAVSGAITPGQLNQHRCRNRSGSHLGHRLPAWADQRRTNQHALGVAVDAAGNLYIADTQDSCVLKANVTSRPSAQSP